MKKKVIAFYLPQFHAIPENNKWWGEGFTDWVSAKKAEPMFKNHNQPRVPYHNNYYNLLDKSTVKWQTHIAKKAGIYGFCMYHYWFGNGNQLLEKPAENFLEWKDINMNYCFSWDNNSWVRTWSRIRGGGTWTTLENTNTISENDNGILMKQEFGNEEEWKEHFEYLLPFFKDGRYIKKDGKPIFVIYNITLFSCISLMIECWNRLANENGLPGIYIISMDAVPGKSSKVDGVLRFEPNYTRKEIERDYPWISQKYMEVRKKFFKKLPYILDYGFLWRKILKRSLTSDNEFIGAFVDFDATPRKGVNGFVTQGASPNKFYKYFSRLLMKTNSEFIFLNGWNEWGEGAYLEPDEKYKYAYLIALKKAIERVKCKYEKNAD